MTEALLLGVATLTSVVAIVILRRSGAGGSGTGGLVAAVGVALEAVGATVLFFVANLILGATLILFARRVFFYASLYETADVSLLVLSLLQAITLTAWLHSR